MMSGRSAPVLAGEPGAGPAEPGHHLVGDQQHAVLAADVLRWPASSRPAARRRRGPRRRPARRRTPRPGSGPIVLDQRVELGGVRAAAAVGVGVGERAAVLVRRRGVPGAAEPRQVRRPQARAARRRPAWRGCCRGRTPCRPITTCRSSPRARWYARAIFSAVSTASLPPETGNSRGVVHRQQRSQLVGVRLERVGA